MATIQKRVRGGKTTYRVRYRDPGGHQRSKVFARKADAQRFLNETEAAGHTSVSFTLDRYGHLYPESDAALRDRLDAIYSSGQRDQDAAVLDYFRSGRGPSAAPERRERRGHSTDDALTCGSGGGGEGI